MRPRRPAVRRLAVPGPLAAASLVLLLAGPGAAPAGAATARHAPCPTTGTTLYRTGKGVVPGLRVYRVGGALRSCTRTPGKRLRIRALGPWTSATKVAVGGALLTWTTRTTGPDGSAADTIRSTYTATGERGFTIANAAVATSATTPATKDTVVGLQTDGLGTAWVTSQGRLGLRVALPELVPAEDPQPFRDGATYALRDVGPGQASALAAQLSLVDDSETDPCGGVFSHALRIGAVAGAPASSFTYYEEPARASPDC